MDVAVEYLLGNNVQMVRSCILKTPQILVAKDSKQRTLLHYSVCKGLLGMVQCLLQYPQQLQSRDEAGYTALALAAINGYPNIVELLLQRGAHPDTPDAQGKTPLMHCLQNGNRKSADKLMQYRAKRVQNVSGLQTCLIGKSYSEPYYQTTSQDKTYIKFALNYLIGKAKTYQNIKDYRVQTTTKNERLSYGPNVVEQVRHAARDYDSVKWKYNLRLQEEGVRTRVDSLSLAYRRQSEGIRQRLGLSSKYAQKYAGNN